MDRGIGRLPQDSAAASDHTRGASLVAPDLSNPAVWATIIQKCNPASLIVLIEARLGDLATNCGAPDILQEALLRAWEGRCKVDWRGQRAFRSWLLTVIDHCIGDARDWHNAAKRGGGHVRPFSAFENSYGKMIDPSGSTTPSRVAIHQERAAIMRKALADLPEDVRQIIHMRLFEQMTLQQIAERVDLPFATVQHRVRRGAILYRDRLHFSLALSSQSGANPGHSQESTPNSPSDSVP